MGKFYLGPMDDDRDPEFESYEDHIPANPVMSIEEFEALMELAEALEDIES